MAKAKKGIVKSPDFKEANKVAHMPKKQPMKNEIQKKKKRK